MSVRRLTLALTVAFVLSVAATYAFWTLSKRQTAGQYPATQKVVAAKTDLQPGTPLTADNVELVDWPQQFQLTGTFSKVEDLKGRSLIYPVSAKQPVLDHDVAAAGSGIGLAVKIAEGMRAVSIKSNEVVGVAGFLYPGSHVDVLLTHHSNDKDPMTRTILQDVEVLTAGQKIEPDPQGKPENVNVVTLLLAPHDAEKLVLAESQGTVQFVLRNGADQSQAQTQMASLPELLGAPSAPAVKPVARKKVAPVVQPAVYSVEFFSGDKHTVETFK